MGKLFKKMLLSVTVTFVLVVFNAYLVEAKSLKKGEVYSSLDGAVIEVISSSELEISGGGKDIIAIAAEYDFKGDKLRVVASIMGTKMVLYYLLTEEGLKDEKTGKVYYSKAGLSALEEKKKAEEEKRSRAASGIKAAEFGLKNAKEKKVVRQFTAKWNELYKIPDTDFTVKIIGFVSDFAFHEATKTVFTKSAEHNNPAINVEVYKAGKLVSRPWLFYNYPDLFAAIPDSNYELIFQGYKSLLAE